MGGTLVRNPFSTPVTLSGVLGGVLRPGQTIVVDKTVNEIVTGSPGIDGVCLLTLMPDSYLGPYDTAYVSSGGALSDDTPQPTGTAVTAGPGTAEEASRADHVHATEVTIADISDAGAAGAAVLAAMTVEGVRSAIGAAGESTVVYDFAKALGVTLTDGSAGGTAAVTGGVLALTCPSTPEARYYGGNREAPRGSVALPTSGGRPPLRWRATARLKSLSSLSVPRMLAKNAFGAAVFAGFYVAATGSLGAENNSSLTTYATAGAGSLPTDGTGWLEIECNGETMLFRYGTGTTSTAPTSWTTLAVATLAAQVWGTVELVNSTNGAPGSTQLTEWDDLTVVAW